VEVVEEEVMEREKPVLAHVPKIAAVEEEVGGGSRRGGDGEGKTVFLHMRIRRNVASGRGSGVGCDGW
jgi:hypothetical protein